MADTNHLSDLLSNLSVEESAIIEYFVRGQKQAIASQNLKLEYTETSIRLSANVAEAHQPPKFKLLGISKQVNQWQRKVLIDLHSNYRAIAIAVLTEYGFIEREKSSHPEFSEHHYYTVPDGYKLNYTEVIQLWRSWWNNKRYQLNRTSAPIDALIFSKGNWQSIGDLQPKQGSFVLQTSKGQIVIDPEEYVVWIDRIEPIFPNPAPGSSDRLLPSLASTPGKGSESKLSSSVQPVVPLGLPLKDRTPTPSEIHDRSSDRTAEPADEDDDAEYVDLETYLNTFNTEDTEDVDRIEGIYNIGELLSGNNFAPDPTPPAPTPTPQLPLPVTPEPATIPTQPVASAPIPAAPVANPVPPQPPLSLLQRQALLKRKAIEVLATYVSEGDRIVQTEVLKNGQGQEVNRRVVNIQRGCPSWAIAQIEKLKLGKALR